MKVASTITVVAGLFVMLASLCWSSLFPAARSWTEEKAQRMTELGTQAHQLGGARDAARRRPSMHGRSAADIDAEYQQVTAELDELRIEFESKRDAPQRTSSLLRWIGMGLIVSGAIATYSIRSGQES